MSDGELLSLAIGLGVGSALVGLLYFLRRYLS